MAPYRSLSLSPSTFLVGVGLGIFFGFGFAYILLTIDTTPASPHRLWTNASVINAGTVKRLVVENSSKKREFKGVISSVGGGIGNQLYRYACAYALARDLRRPLFNFVPKEKLSAPREFFPHQREFALDKFQIPLTNLFDESTNFSDSSITYVNDSQLLFRTYPTDNVFLAITSDSYCQSEAFWAQYKDEIMTMFELRPDIIQGFPSYVTDLQKNIEETEESVAVHVRRGDFMNSNKTWKLPIPISYQRDSIYRISKILEQRRVKDASRPGSTPKFFIFSDDIEYCKRELRYVSNVHELVFVSDSGDRRSTTSLQEFFLMAKCRHFIIPNSTFSWWAAYISTNKGNKSSSSANSAGIVIASEDRPSYWKISRYNNTKMLNFYKNVIHGLVLFPEGWIIHYPPD